MMGNHGLATVARDVDHAVQNAMFFELACEIILRSGTMAMPLPDEEVQALLKLRKSASGNV